MSDLSEVPQTEPNAASLPSQDTPKVADDVAPALLPSEPQSARGVNPAPAETPSTPAAPVVHTLKRPRSGESITHFLTPIAPAATSPSAPSAPPSVGVSSEGSPASPSSTAAVHGSDSSSVEAAGVPPKQIRTEGSSTPATPQSPYAHLPRKMPRKTPVSTPTSSLNTPRLNSPAVVTPTLTTPPTPAAASTAAAKLAALHQRWAGLLHKVLMQERAAHESDAVLELSSRIVAALPGDLEETKDGFQTLLFSMKDAKNGELRRKVVEGELLVERLVRMDDRELANPELRKKIEETMEDRAKDTNLSELAKAQRTSHSTLFKCKTCGARDTSWYQRQTRSGDEPMTVIITCNQCNTQWRKY